MAKWGEHPAFGASTKGVPVLGYGFSYFKMIVLLVVSFPIVNRAK
jgi:hypothetical protein